MRTKSKLFLLSGSLCLSFLFIFFYHPLSAYALHLNYIEYHHDGLGLWSPRTVVTSPDGKHVYVAAFDTIAVFGRNLLKGEITFIERIKNGCDGAKGVYNTHRIIMSSDGRHLYVIAGSTMYISGGGTGIAIFERDVITGKLKYLDMIGDDELDDELYGAQFMVISADGRNMYVPVSSAASRDTNNSILRFSRDQNSGALVYNGMQKNNTKGIFGMDGPRHICMSRNGNFLYVASYYGNAINVFSRDSFSGDLTFLQTLINDENEVDGLEYVHHLMLSPDETHLYAIANDCISLFARNESSGELTFQEVFRNGDDGITGLNGSKWSLISSDGRDVYITSYSDGSLSHFLRDTNTGKLTYAEMLMDDINQVDGLAGAYGAALSADEKQIYVAGRHNDALAVIDRDEEKGTIGVHSCIMESDGIEGLDDAYSVAVSSDGKNVYATAWDYYDGAVTVFARNPLTGRLTYVEYHSQYFGNTRTRFVLVSPDNLHVYVATQENNRIVVFQRNTNTGTLQWVQTERMSAYPSSISISPDGKHFYVADQLYHALRLYSRDIISGRLTYIEQYKNGENNVEGIEHSSSMGVSPDGNNIYVTDSTNDSVAVFSRDSLTGKLTFTEIYKNLVGGISGINDATDLLISPENQHVYVVGGLDDTLVAFERDMSDGTLNFLKVYLNGTEGIEGMNNPRDMAISEDGKFIFITTWNDTLLVFGRNTTDGSLTFLEFHKDGVNGVKGMGGVNELAVSNDMKNVYVSSYDDEAVAVFSFAETLPVSKAIIIAGGGPSEGNWVNHIWDETRMCTNYAYKALLWQGYGKEDIQYLSFENEDVDGNGLLDDVDGIPDEFNLNHAINIWANEKENPADELLIYIADHGGKGTFQMTPETNLRAEDLDSWLDELQKTMSGRVIVIIEACHSGSFLPLLTPETGQERIVISSSASGEESHFRDRGGLTFSYQFWSQVFNGSVLSRAFSFAYFMMSDYQTAQADINGNGIGNEIKDVASHITIGQGNKSASGIPVIVEVSAEQSTDGTSSAQLWAGPVVHNIGLKRVWAVITPPCFNPQPDLPITDLPVLELEGPDSGGIYSGEYQKFLQNGVYKINIYAEDVKSAYSLPLQTLVNRTDGILCVDKGDCNCDGSVDLRDAIFILHVLSGVDRDEFLKDSCILSGADVNKDEKMGLEEAAFVMRFLSE